MRSAARAMKLDSAPDGSWELARRPPTGALSGHVREIQGYVERAGPLRRRHPATTDVALILSLGAPFRMLDPASGALLAERRCFLAGPSDGYAVVESGGDALCVQVDLAPLGAYRLTGVPMRELCRTAVELDDLFGTPFDLPERLFDAVPADWNARFALVEDFVAARIAAGPRPPAAMDWALAELERSCGATRIGALAAELGWSRKRVARQFGEFVGLPAKTMARMFRFRRGCELIASGHSTLGGVALAAGYADQAHMTREFRQFSGWSPGRYARAEEDRVEGIGIVESG